MAAARLGVLTSVGLPDTITDSANPGSIDAPVSMPPLRESMPPKEYVPGIKLDILSKLFRVIPGGDTESWTE